MKISKNKAQKGEVKASADLCVTSSCNYQCACDSILAAIECLSEHAQSGDVQASQALADLSVILLGLQ